MGSAMRLAPRLLRLIVGLPIVASLAVVFLTPASSAAADSAAAATPGQGSFRTLTPVPRTAVPRWTNGTAPGQESTAGQIVDAAVEQAAWSGPSRRTSHPAAARSLAEHPQGRESSPGRKGPMFRGYELQLPTSLFGRRKAKPNAASTANAQRMASRHSPTGPAGQPFQRN